MDGSLGAMAVAAAFGAFWALVLGIVVILRLRAGPPRLWRGRES